VEHLTPLILQYRYFILIPLSFVEGPIIAFFAGSLASLGYFNIYVLAVFFFMRDVIVDGLCYWIGYSLRDKSFVRKIASKVGITDDHLEDAKKLWSEHPGKTMFLSKLAYGVAAGLIVVAGMVRMPFKKFMTWGAVVAILHYITLLFLGYFFASSFGSIENILSKIQYVVLALVVLATAYYFFKRYMGRKLKEQEEKVFKK
jgi:membrane protein DedA with SNARE-associated domain